MLIVGLTGSIGMGKSATANLFRGCGIPVHDSDQAVHRLYAGPAARLIEQAFPGSTNAEGVDREKLGKIVFGNPGAITRLEAIVHPLVREHVRRFHDLARQSGCRMVVQDVPLLFETGGETRVDLVVVVSAPTEIQRARVLARPGMTAEKFESILARQVPDSQKRRKAHYVIDTSASLAHAEAQVAGFLRACRI